MNIIFRIVCIFTFIHVSTALKFYRGHLVGYDIPPPTSIARDDDTVSTEFIHQRLDHYDPTNKILWSQRYYVNTEFMDTTKRNVAFLYIGGESQASIYWMTNGAWIDSAQTHGALLFSLEHRFFGKSHPFSDLSTENLRYLSSRQALNDLSHFISAMNKKYELAEDVKWIVIGGSYAGAVAAWLRQKYPHLVQGAVSSSGPLLAKYDFPEYLQVVIDDLALHSQECVDNLKKAIDQLEDLIQNPNEEDLNSLFFLCDDIKESSDNPLDLANFFELIADNFAGVAQYHDPRSSLYNIDIVCGILNDESKGKEVYRLAAVNNFVEGLNEEGSSCFDYKYDNIIQKWKNETVTDSGMMRQWIYQTCTEFGYYQTSSQEIQVFGNRFPLDFFTRVCVDIFGEKFNEAFIDDKIKHSNTYYGALDIEVSNVVYVHGTVDPWHVLGITETRDPEAPAILINGTSHCADIYSPNEFDLPELTAAREEIKKLIGVWLGV